MLTLKKILCLFPLLFIWSCSSPEDQVPEVNYPFIPDNLKLISLEELYENPPPELMEPVYFEDGTLTTWEESLPLIMSQDLIPRMFVDANGDYAALVVVRRADSIGEVIINYPSMPDELASLGYSLGNPDSERVVIFAQAGPTDRLFTYRFQDMFDEAADMDFEENYFVNVHQVQTLNPELFGEEKEITFEQAKEYSKSTTEMIYKVTEYFKSEGKKVFVVGISFGSFVVNDLIAEYGNIADGYLTIGGRLNLNETHWKAFSEGKMIEYSENSEVIVKDKAESIMRANMAKLGASFGYKRYSQLLASSDLSNLLYVHSEKDEMVGPLTEEELTFLKQKNATLLTSDLMHRQLTIRYLKKGLDLLLEN